LAIERAGRYVERVTGRWFEPRALTLTLNGRGSRGLLLDHPIIAIEWIKTEAGAVDLESVRVFNRHVTEGLLEPDARNSPRIDLVAPFALGPRWQRGSRNITVRGVFGFTDPDGSAEGETPLLIRRVVQLLVMKDLAKLANVDDRFDARERYRLVSERTREQS